MELTDELAPDIVCICAVSEADCVFLRLFA